MEESTLKLSNLDPSTLFCVMSLQIFGTCDLSPCELIYMLDLLIRSEEEALSTPTAGDSLRFSIKMLLLGACFTSVKG